MTDLHTYNILLHGRRVASLRDLSADRALWSYLAHERAHDISCEGFTAEHARECPHR